MFDCPVSYCAQYQKYEEVNYLVKSDHLGNLRQTIGGDGRADENNGGPKNRRKLVSNEGRDCQKSITFQVTVGLAEACQ